MPTSALPMIVSARRPPAKWTSDAWAGRVAALVERWVGVRMALGAPRAQILRLFLGQGVKWAMLGGGAGLLSAFMLVRFMQSMLFEVGPYDPTIFVSDAAMLMTVVLMASYLPALRALFLHDDETRAKVTLEAEAMRAVYDDPSWVYRALELWKLSGHNDSQLACSAIHPIRANEGR